MLSVSRKCYYALTAVLELAKRGAAAPATIAEIAAARRVPPKFLAVILGQLKHAGLVVSYRGTRGGYILALPAEKLTVARVIACIDGRSDRVAGPAHVMRRAPDVTGDPLFGPLWRQAEQAVANIFEQTTFQTLVEREWQQSGALTGQYSI